MGRDAVRRQCGSLQHVWRQLRAEDLPADLGTFRVVTFAQSFHRMDRLLVARRVRDMLSPGGGLGPRSATTHRGVAGDELLPYPRPPWAHIEDLVGSYRCAGRPARRAGLPRTGPRAGQGWLPVATRAGEEEIMRQAGWYTQNPIRTLAGLHVGGALLDASASRTKPSGNLLQVRLALPLPVGVSSWLLLGVHIGWWEEVG
jgi:hypothetical protein